MRIMSIKFADVSGGVWEYKIHKGSKGCAFNDLMSPVMQNMLLTYLNNGIPCAKENESLQKENDALYWAILDHLGTVERSGYDVNHFCPAMVKLINEKQCKTN